MVLLEHDGKALLAAHGVPVPAGCLLEPAFSVSDVSLPPGPWVVKAQLPVGGRGKAGLVRMASTQAEVESMARAMFGREHRGRTVGSVRVESRSDFTHEAYVGFMPAAEAGAVRVLVSATGGVEIESSGSIRASVVAGQHEVLVQAVAELSRDAPEKVRAAVTDAAKTLARIFLERDATLVEINPLFVRADGAWIAGDAKIVIDDNALFRQPDVVQLLEARAHAYPETHLKWKHGFDYVVVDPEGELGLLTTGAGLSMMLIDELRASGIRPYNFLDVRTGGLRGDASRLVHVLEWIAEGKRVKCVLVNVFAGITHLGEFSRLLVQALREAPALRVPVVTRLIGNGLDEARAVLGEAGIAVEPDLNAALALVRAALAKP